MMLMKYFKIYDDELCHAVVEKLILSVVKIVKIDL